jgi:hypothetical protein
MMTSTRSLTDPGNTIGRLRALAPVGGVRPTTDAALYRAACSQLLADMIAEDPDGRPYVPGWLAQAVGEVEVAESGPELGG